MGLETSSLAGIEDLQKLHAAAEDLDSRAVGMALAGEGLTSLEAVPSSKVAVV